MEDDVDVEDVEDHNSKEHKSGGSSQKHKSESDAASNDAADEDSDEVGSRLLKMDTTSQNKIKRRSAVVGRESDGKEDNKVKSES